MAHVGPISSKYQELVSKSIKISSGRPAVYELRPEKQQCGTLTRLTVGERNPDQPNKTVLLVGETGTGKSTMINALFNYSIGVMWEDDIWFQIVQQEDGDQTESQTSDVIMYQMFGGTTLPYSLTIIDTPGFGSTKGIEHDYLVSERLLDLFRSQDDLREIHVVGLVMKSSMCRLSDRLLYSFNSITSLFGKDLQRNIVALLTYSDGVASEDALQALEAAKIDWIRNENNELTHFLFNNRQTKEKNDKNKRNLKHAWEVTFEGMDQFSNFLDKASPHKLDETLNVLKKRTRLSACIQNLQERVRLIELKQVEIQQTQEAVRQHEREMTENKEFKFQVDEPYKYKEKIEGGWWFFFFYSGATNCTICEETCHYPCEWSRDASGCAVMKSGRCIVCSGKCPSTDHVKADWRYVVKTRNVTKTNKEMQKNYEKNKSDHDRDSTLLEDLKNDTTKMTDEKCGLLNEAYQHVISLERIALNVNSVTTYVHYDFLIERMKETGDKAKVEELEKIKLRVEKENPLTLKYVLGRVRGFGDTLRETVGFKK